jgi:hypothetical protein
VSTGPYQERVAARGHHVEGLGAELESRYGVDTAVQQDMDRHHGAPPIFTCEAALELPVASKVSIGLLSMGMGCGRAGMRLSAIVRLHLTELSDALRENLDHFLPTDVIVLNIGNDYK